MKSYIPYDNHPTVHVVSVPTAEEKSARLKFRPMGMMLSALDPEKQLLYVSSWAYGEIEVLDLKQGKLLKTIRDLGVIPHMFSMDFNPSNYNLVVPLRRHCG